MRAVNANTLTGKIAVLIIRFIGVILYLFKGKKWKYPIHEFSEDPRIYSFTDILYFAYKYYIAPHVAGSLNTQTEIYFAGQGIEKYREESEEEEISLHAGGDLMPYEWIQDKYCQYLWDDIGTDFFSGDVVFANLETPIDLVQKVSHVPEMMLNDMHFNGDENMFRIFNGNNQYKGFDILSTANNHSLDMGASGVDATISFLKQKNIVSVGTASSEAERQEAKIIRKKGINIGFVAYTFSLNKLQNPIGQEYLSNYIEFNKPSINLVALTADVKRTLDAGADIIVASIHYGNAYQAYPSAHIIEVTHRIFSECGVDIIIGGHPHNIQPMEYYSFNCPFTGERKKGFAVYSLADFVAYDIFNWCHLPVYLKINIGKKAGKVMVKNIKAVPVYCCGIYNSSSKRELRFMDATRLWANLSENKIPEFMHNKHIHEARELEKFYQNYFKQCL
jgi:poly-gamma-glutamate synthesis protein (capsule biosynthesis protein)